MTNHEQEILEHIINGNKVIVPGYTEPVLLSRLTDDEYDITIPIDELTKCTIYFTEDQLTIQALKEELADMTNKLKEIQTQKRKLGEKYREINGSGPKPIETRAYGKHLKADEVKEIEEIFKRDFSTKLPIVVKAYGVSTTIAHRIKKGEHGKSSEEYKRHLRNIGQLK
jgi:uncharacterized coiled-coil protein SlyX